jgi:hypothetical protein
LTLNERGRKIAIDAVGGVYAPQGIVDSAAAAAEKGELHLGFSLEEA